MMKTANRLDQAKLQELVDLAEDPAELLRLQRASGYVPELRSDQLVAPMPDGVVPDVGPDYRR